MDKKTVKDIDIKDKIVLVRTDYNVPLRDGQIEDTFRIVESFATLKYLLDHGAAKIIVMSHMGRPEGHKVPSLSLAPVAPVLAEGLGVKVDFVDDVSGPEVEMAVEQLKKGEILLLENLRFSPGEEANSEDFAREIIASTHADLVVEDGFAVVHRAHASTAAIAHIVPAVAGLLVEKEVTALSKVTPGTKNVSRPLLVIIGGAKVEDKQPLVEAFLPVADKIAVGGKIAADGYTAPESYDTKSNIIYVAEDFDTDGTGAKLDIGPVATAEIAKLIDQSQTVIWNGALGKVEDPAFDTSSTVVAKLLGENPSIYSVILGGDTMGFVRHLQSQSPELKYSLVSTGGGAALEFLLGKELPGIESLEDKGAHA